MESKRASELQEGGRHYKDMPIQPAEFCQRNRLNWCESNVVKYVARHASKNGAQDIRKAIHYLNLLLEWEYPAHGKTAADYTPLAPEQVADIIAAHCPPSLCASCIRTSTCGMKEAMAPSLANGACVQYLPREGDGEGVAATSRQWTHEPEAVALSFFLPSITVEGSMKDVRDKYLEERKEWGQCDAGTLASDIEAWDVIQVRQTYGERGGIISSLTYGKPEPVVEYLEYWHTKSPERISAAKRAMIVKNAARAMYAPEVCLKIVMSGGREF